MKKSDKSTLKYVGLAFAAIFFLPKLLKKTDQEDSALDTAEDTLTDPTVTTPPPPPYKVHVSSMKVLPEGVTANGAKSKIYIYVRNPTESNAVLKSLQGDIYLGPSKIIRVDLVQPTQLPAVDETIIPITAIIGFKNIPQFAAEKISTGAWIPGAYFKGNLTLTNGSGLNFKQPLELLDLNEISGLRRVAMQRPYSMRAPRYGLPYIQSILNRKRYVVD